MFDERKLTMDKKAMLGMLVEMIDLFNRLTGGALQYICGPLKDATEKFGGEDGEWWLEDFKRFLRRELDQTKMYLRRLFADQEIMVDETDGTETFRSAGFVIGYVHSDYKPVQEYRPATKATVHELVRDSKFADFFGSVGEKRGRWTEAQVVKFCRKNRNKLRIGGRATFFELEGGFVAIVYVYSDGRLCAYVDRFDDDNVWIAYYRHRVVLPQQTLESEV